MHLKLSNSTKMFLIDAVIRAVRTMAQTALGVIGAGMTVSDVDWMHVLSASFLAGIVSVLMSLDRIKNPTTIQPAASGAISPPMTQTTEGGGSHDGE